MTFDLRQLSTSTISDALDMLGLDGGCPGLRPLAPGMSLFGPAYTLAFAEAGGEPAPAADYIDDVPAGAVVVMANAGRMTCTVWGDLLTVTARRRGVAGTVIDGCCRDADGIVRLGYPVFSRAAFMKSGKNRVRLVAVNQRVSIAGQAVEPGDHVRADDSGVLIIPAARLGEVADICQRIEAMEAKVLADVEAGVAMREARHRHGYNQFVRQSPETRNR